MIRARTWIFRALAAAFIAGCLWWSLYVPYAPDRLYRAIPADVTILSAHHDIAGRWSMLSSNPVTATLLASLGLDRPTLDDLNRNPDFHLWLKRLASDELVVAYKPGTGANGRPTWIVASWVGGQSQRLRWMLSLTRSIKPVLISRHAVWIVHPPHMKNSPRIAFTLVEGMAVGCIGDDLTAMDDVLRCLDGAYPSLAKRADLIPASAAADRGWFRQDRTAERYSYELRNLTGTAVKGDVTMPFTMPAALPAADSLEGLEKVWGDAPLAYAVVDRSLTVAWMNRAQLSWVNAIAEHVARAPGPEIALGLFGGEFSGRFKGLKLPTVMAGCSSPNPDYALDELAEHIDGLNAQVKWGLVPREIAVGTRKVYAIESTEKNFYSKLTPSECVGYAAETNWLIFSSNVEGLSNLLASATNRPRRSVALQESAPARGWINLEKGGKAIRLAITAYSFKLALDDPSGSQPQRQRLNEIKAWIDALAPLKVVRFWAENTGGMTKVTFEAGE